MSHRTTFLAAACLLALAACSNGTTPPPATDATATPAADVTTPAEPAAPADCSTTIGSNDAMQFDAASIAIPAACTEFTIRLSHNGQMPVAAMGHNLVVSSEANMAGVLADGMAAGAADAYVKPGDPRVLAHTPLIGGGEETSVTFPVTALQGAGPFVFFCSFPGHSALMKGTVAVL